MSAAATPLRFAAACLFGLAAACGVPGAAPRAAVPGLDPVSGELTECTRRVSQIADGIVHTVLVV